MASPLTIQPDAAAGKDAHISSSAPTTNYGTATGFWVGDTDAAASNATRSLLAFDLSGIPPGATITSATLSLWEYSAQSNGPASWAAELRRVLRNWVEAEATWNNYSTAGGAWATAGCSNATDRVAAASASLTLDATAAGAFVSWSGAGLVADVQAWVDGTASNYGWLLSAPTAELLGAAQVTRNSFYSSDWTTDAAQRPKLVIEYTGGGTVPVNLLRTHILAQGVV